MDWGKGSNIYHIENRGKSDLEYIGHFSKAGNLLVSWTEVYGKISSDVTTLWFYYLSWGQWE